MAKNSDVYSTPHALFNELDREFHFTLDACADEKSHKCDRYFTEEDNGLIQSWGGETVWCNPPYSETGKWVQKAYEESRKPNTAVVMLLPTTTSAAWFFDYILYRTEIRYIQYRLYFGNSKSCAPFASMIVIFRSGKYPIARTYKDFRKD